MITNNLKLYFPISFKNGSEPKQKENQAKKIFESSHKHAQCLFSLKWSALIWAILMEWINLQRISPKTLVFISFWSMYFSYVVFMQFFVCNF